MSDLVLVHFDSHPDLLIPTNMQADTVFNKDQLYDTISIENWILPLVYAGHITDIVWVKPPWCHQIEDKTLKFYVGMCEKSGKIRTTCTESYFISETLYCPESSLLNKQCVTLTVFTVKPNSWDDLSHTGDNIQSKSARDLDTKQISSETPCRASADPCIDREKTLDVGKLDNGSMVLNCNPGTSLTNSAAADNLKRSANGGGNVNHTNSNEHQTIKKRKIGDGLEEKVNSDDRLFSSEILDRFEQICDNFRDRHIILDIDLDFYSTKNPFQVMYSEKQYQILKELYAFEKPTASTDKAIERCVRDRQVQLDSLKSVWETLQEDPKVDINHPKISLIKELHQSLQGSTTNHQDVDYELLHEAGCTCDDTELPHHVSSQGQINLLVDATQEILCHMKKPTIVTMARSSSDDYCPPDQVDMIQEKILDMLKELYLEISVTEDYETAIS
ncbi:hypothetical protein FSP39_012357 [Pinctada imbricata]|uniref:Uncharacterized protein n=1 Tax=Pinctada imbricata TaxID=66713 RepID=A0AA89BSQ7_PINIB|nr:hypothetical protein FSP39_012357 [Pinctada imbricata]